MQLSLVFSVTTEKENTEHTGEIESFMFLAVVIMTCVFHLLGVKHGRDQLGTRLLMNGGLGYPMVKLLGTYSFLSYLNEFSNILVCYMKGLCMT